MPPQPTADSEQEWEVWMKQLERLREAVAQFRKADRQLREAALPPSADQSREEAAKMLYETAREVAGKRGVWLTASGEGEGQLEPVLQRDSEEDGEMPSLLRRKEGSARKPGDSLKGSRARADRPRTAPSEAAGGQEGRRVTAGEGGPEAGGGPEPCPERELEEAARETKSKAKRNSDGAEDESAPQAERDSQLSPLGSDISKARQEDKARRLAQIETFLKANGYSGIEVPKKTRLKTKFPIHTAAKQGDDVIVGLLIRERADPSQKDSWGQTALEVAKAKNCGCTHRRVIMDLERITDLERAGSLSKRKTKASAKGPA